MIKTIGLAILTNVIFFSCKTPSQKIFEGVFEGGRVQVLKSETKIDEQTNISLVTRFILKKEQPEYDNYFQYKLGEKVKLLINGDTLEPQLFYYVPLVRSEVRELHIKYLINNTKLSKQKQMIIDDSVLQLNKVHILFN